MRATITIAVEHNGPDNAGGAVITGEDGQTLAEISTFFEKSNKVYASYKTLFTALSICRRLGASDLVIEETDAGLYHELQGNLNRNQKLYRMFRQRIEKYGFTYVPFRYDPASERYQAAKSLAERGMTTRGIISHVL